MARRIARVATAVLTTLVAGAILAVPAGAGGSIVFETQFQDPAEEATTWGFPAGETSVTEDGYTAAFTPGALTMTLEDAPNLWMNPEIDAVAPDQAVEVRVESSTGDESALFGVVCRGTLHDAGYVFLVGTDGYFTIGRFDDRGKAKAIVNAKGDERTDLVDPTGTNIVRGECTGKKRVTLTLSVNGEEVTSFVDKKPPKKAGRDIFVVTEVADGGQTETVVTGFAAFEL